jgi:Mn2+/Fe2+ NRAMP family transporter
LAIGKYNALDSLIKIVAIVLLVSTVTAFILVLYNGPIEPVDGFITKELITVSGLFFLLALMGWMPAPLEISSWNSLWTLERIKQSKYTPKLKETIFEFKLTYLITGILAVMFVTLGSYIFFGSGEELPNNNAQFANQVVTLYTGTIGNWSHIIISASAFAIMFGTIIAVFDGYSRSLKRTIELLFTKNENIEGIKSRILYVVILLIIAIGSLVIIFQFGDNLKALVDFATVLSFVVAPIIAIFNFRLVTGKFLPKINHPSTIMKITSVAGIVFLIGFALIFLIMKITS